MFFLCWFWNKLVMIRRRNQLQSKSWGPTCNIRCTWPPWLLCDYYLDYIFFLELFFCRSAVLLDFLSSSPGCGSFFLFQSVPQPEFRLTWREIVFWQHTHSENRNSLDLKRWIPNENQSDSGEQHACCTLGTWRRVVGKTFCRVTKRPSLFWVALSKPLAVRGPASTVDDGNVALGSFSIFLPSFSTRYSTKMRERQERMKRRDRERKQSR